MTPTSDPPAAAAVPPPPPVPSRRGLWHPRRIGWRLALGFGILVLVMLGALVKANLHIHLITELTQRFATADLPRLLRVQALSLQTEGVAGSLTRLMYAPRAAREQEYAHVDGLNRNIQGLIESLQSDADTAHQQQILQRLVAARAVYQQAFLATVDEVEADNLPGAARVLTEAVNPALKDMLLHSNALLDSERVRIEEALAQAQRTFTQVAAWLVVLSALAIVLALWLAVRTTRAVVGPLGVLEAAARRIAQGDYAVQVPPTRAEEVDRVGQALNAMVAAIGQREQQITQLAYYDALTGLPNRTRLLSDTPQSPPQQATFDGVVLLDLARLRTVNETLGFATGDQLIRETALRIRQQLAQSPDMAQAVAVRLSGGTLAVAWNAVPRQAVMHWFERLCTAMAAPVHCGGYSVDANLVGGFADAADAPEPVPAQVLMRNADVALNAAKRSKSDHAWYSASMDAARLSHLSLVSDLRQAVAESQLQMWLQPKFDLHSARPVGAEALVRWQHPQRGFISPAEFVPFAEQTGYISMVTRWMLERALNTLAAWEKTHPELYIAVNISTHDLRSTDFRNVVRLLLERHGVDPARLRLEIVESGLMDDPQASVAELRALRDMGVGLSIDDFGTGYSSLAYLQQLPVSELKIDRSFVSHIDAQPTTQRLFKTMVDMGKGLGLSITAEGVETEAERATITSLGCEVMQGYLGSKPLFGASLQAWLAAQRGVLDLSL
ncbi:MAG: putative bifunctional diguanylate cyclase/phosphodiesterase [Rhodoferax sp.]